MVCPGKSSAGIEPEGSVVRLRDFPSSSLCQRLVSCIARVKVDSLETLKKKTLVERCSGNLFSGRNKHPFIGKVA